MSDKILVCGAGGFVGGAMVKFLRRKGFANIRAVSSRPVDQWIHVDPVVENRSLDLRYPGNCIDAVQDCKWIYNFAAKVGGIGYIGEHKLECMLSSLINTNLLIQADRLPDRIAGYFFASSACVYGSSEFPIKESTPLSPSSGYGEEKVFSERMCRAFGEERRMPIRIARFTGIYGPGDTIKGKEGKDHAPAALCRKVASAKLTGQHEIAIWGSGQQTRNFLYIDDCVEAAYRMMHSGPWGGAPVNVGSAEVTTVNDLVGMLEEIAGVKLQRFYDLHAPEGVGNRSYCLDTLRMMTNWTPPTDLKTGLRNTFTEIWDQVIRER